MRLKHLGLALPLALAMVACEDNSVQKFGETADGTGVWHGYVRDAKTGDFINFFNPDDATTNDDDNDAATNQIWALVQGEIRTAQPCANEDGENQLQNGCFFIDGLPLDETTPVFVRHSSYEAFSATLSSSLFASTVFPADTDTDEREALLFRGSPQAYRNVRLFPKGLNYDYTITATFNDRGVEGIVIRCVYDDQDAFDVLGHAVSSNYLSPNFDFTPIVSATTDANGQAVLDGASLTKGGDYHCYAHGTDPVTGAVVSCDSDGECDSFVVGIDDQNQVFELDFSDDRLFAVWNNYSDGSTPLGSLSGPVTIVTNRPVKQLAGSENCPQATVSVGLANTADTATTDVTADDNATSGSDSVTVSIDTAGTTITIAPNYDTTDAGDRDVSMDFAGIFLLPSSGQGNATIYSLGGSGGSMTNTSTFALNNVAGDCDSLDDGDELEDTGGSDLSTSAYLVGY